MQSYFHPNSFGKEGVDHLNISRRSDTPLGVLLDPSYYKVVDYPMIGKFASVINLWYWLKSSPLDDSLRRLSGPRLRNRAETSGRTKRTPNFVSIIGYATYIKLLEYPHLLNELKNLPTSVELVSYYTPKGTGVRICSSYAKVIVAVVDVIRVAVRNRVEPDFSVFNTTESNDGYHYLEPFLLSRFGKERMKDFVVEQK